MNKIFSCLLILALFSPGCATLEKNRGARLTPKLSYEHDFSKTPQTGILKIECRPPSEQLIIDEYVINIDNEFNAQVSKHSDVDITLDEGDHDLVFYAIPTGMKGLYGNKFGKQKNASVKIKENQMTIIRYYGPYSMFSDGDLEIIIE